MRVLHVIHSLDPRSGGPSHAIRQMVNAQIQFGMTAEIVASSVQSAEPWQSENLQSSIEKLGLCVRSKIDAKTKTRS